MEHRASRTSFPKVDMNKWDTVRLELHNRMQYKKIVDSVKATFNSIEHRSIFDGDARYGAIVCNGNGCKRDLMQYSLKADLPISEIPRYPRDCEQATTSFILVFDHDDDGSIHRFMHMFLSKKIFPVFVFENEMCLTDFSREIHSLAGAFSSPNFRMIKFSITVTSIDDQMNNVMQIVYMHLPISLTQKTWDKLLVSLSIHGSSFQLLNEIHHTVTSEVPEFMVPILYNQSFTKEHISSILYLWNCGCGCWNCSCYNEDNLRDLLQEWENLLCLKESLESSMPYVAMANLDTLPQTRLTSPQARDFQKVLLHDSVPKDIALECVYSMLQASPLGRLLI